MRRAGQGWGRQDSPGKSRPDAGGIYRPWRREGVPGRENMCEHTAGWSNEPV